MTIEERAAFEMMYEACLNADGAYKAIRTVGLGEDLPGLVGCEIILRKAIELADKIFDKDSPRH